ncbi:hypothetical protein O181_122997, partial [Austropuccinia psidii MF-1]|nr:hypothetical protein [Austropuccinia psidii MF-1]
ARPFVQTLSPSHKAGMLTAVTCDQMHHVHFCMGHMCIAPTMQIQRGPHDHPPGCRALYETSRVSPAFIPRRQPTLVMLANKHTRNVRSLSAPSNHEARGVLSQDALARTPLWSTMMKQYPSPNGDRERFRTISPVPSSIDLSTPPPRPPSDGHFTPRPERSDYPANEGWRWKEDIQAWADRHHVLSPMGFKRQ